MRPPLQATLHFTRIGAAQGGTPHHECSLHLHSLCDPGWEVGAPADVAAGEAPEDPEAAWCFSKQSAMRRSSTTVGSSGM
mmetsp:Transcript_6421/g.8948  ORF Transcript_6421/g.8948 Transcript_6421/m.8948 type:complete len:80 (+) Transcript_6421:62-301(+)